jgi:hypothetical protein
MTIEPMEPMTTNGDNTPINPFLQDSYHMGTTLGKNVTVMYPNFPKENCEYLILVNTMTGERKRVVL